MDHRFGDAAPRAVFKSPSDTVIPHMCLFSGMPDRHLRAGCRLRRAIGVSCFLSFLVRASQPDQLVFTVTVLAVWAARACSAAAAGFQVSVISCSRM